MKYTWLVEKYLEGELHGKELRDFELQILKDPAVAREVEEIRKLHAFVGDQIKKKYNDILLEDEATYDSFSVEELQADMNELKIRKLDPEDVEFQKFSRKVKSASLAYRIRENEKNKIVLNRKIFWGAAAMLAIILGFSFSTILLTNRSMDLQTIYSEYYQSYHYSQVVRNTEAALQDVFDLGAEAYNHANYGLALDYFNKVSADSPSYTTSFLFKGICFMETDQFEQAIQAFNNLSENRILNEYGEWYRGLCYIRLNNPEQARNEFEKIVQKEGYYSKQAKSILKSL
jgi:hypothetical protein